MTDKMILTAGPSITRREIDYVTDAIINGHEEQWGDYLHKFEKDFADYIGVRHALCTSSCTGAMHLGLAALGIGKGDEVIIPDLSWIATASVVTYVGATPVFADVDERSWCINPSSIVRLINKKTKAIMPVHLYGHPSDMITILSIAKKYNLKVIEDAAPSLGAGIDHRKTGSFGNVAGFSFQGAKLLSTGEGGMVVTDDSVLFEKIKHYAEHGRSGKGFEISDIGFKYKMSNLQAAWGVAQLERINDLLEKKRLINSWYREELRGIEGLRLNKISTEAETANYWMTSVILEEDFGISRDQVMKELNDNMIDTRPFFPPISSFRMFTGADNPIAKRLSENGINLPSAHKLLKEHVVYICDCLKSILRV